MQYIKHPQLLDLWSAGILVVLILFMINLEGAQAQSSQPLLPVPLLPRECEYKVTYTDTDTPGITLNQIGWNDLNSHKRLRLSTVDWTIDSNISNDLSFINDMLNTFTTYRYNATTCTGSVRPNSLRNGQIYAVDYYPLDADALSICGITSYDFLGTTTVNGVLCNHWNIPCSFIYSNQYLLKIDLYYSVADNMPVSIVWTSQRGRVWSNNYSAFSFTQPESSLFQLPDICMD